MDRSHQQLIQTEQEQAERQDTLEVELEQAKLEIDQLQEQLEAQEERSCSLEQSLLEQIDKDLLEHLD